MRVKAERIPSIALFDREDRFLGGLGELLASREALENVGRISATEGSYYTGRIEYLVDALKQRESSLAWRLSYPFRALQSLLAERKMPTPPDWDLVADLARKRRKSETEPPCSACYAEKLLVGPDGPLLIDCSNFSMCNHGTGISRVVENIGKFVAAQTSARDCLMSRFVTDVPVVANSAFDGSANRMTGLPILGFREIVLLDASWAFMDRLQTFLPVVRRLGIKVTTCIYDLIPLESPEFLPAAYCRLFAEWIDLAVRYSDNFICISEATASSMAAYLERTRTARPRTYGIGYWRLGSAFESRSDDLSSGNSGLPEKYCLMVGSLAPHKNHHKVLDAMERLWESGHSDLSLVVAGRSGHGGESVERRIAQHGQLGKRLFRLADPNDGDLQAAYAGATLVVQASFTEGFGLPVVEAASHGKAMALSDIPIFREIVSANAFFFDPASAESIAASIVKCLESGCPPVEARRCSWNESAKEFISVIQNGVYPVKVLH